MLIIVDGVGKAHAQGQVAGGVLVKEGVVEQQAGLADGAVVGHQGALAQVGAALVHGDELGEQVVVLVGVPLHRLALMEANPEAVDKLALVGQGLGGVDHALGPAPLGGDETLLGGDVGVEDDAPEAGLAAAAEMSLGDHAHGKLGAVGAVVMELLYAQAVEIFAAAAQVLIVGLPGGHGVVVHPGGGENGLPQLLHGLGGPQLREQLLGPRLAGDGGDAPLVLVLQLVPEGLDDGIPLLLGLGHLLLVDALQAVGIVGDEVDAAGNVVHIVLPAGQLIVSDGAQGGEAGVAVVELLEGLVVPVHHHLLGLAAVALLHHHGHELRLIQLGDDENLLARLHVDAAAGDEAGILTQNRLLHG